MRRAPCAIGAIFLLAAGAGVARADDPAQQQFDYGLSEMNARRFATGCPALDESYRLDPRPGTLFTAAACNARWGKTATALADYEQYLALYDRMAQDQKARQGERKHVAARQREALNKLVPSLAVTASPGMSPSAVIRRDGIVLGGPMLGAALPIDPGEHVVRVELPDGRSAEKRVTLHDAEHLQVEAPELAEAATPTPEATPVPATPPPSEPQPPVETHASSRRTWVWVSVGVGGAGLAVAGVTGALALSKKGDASSHCDGSGGCDTASAASAGNSARSFANIESVGLIVAGAGAVAAGILWLTRPSAHVSATASRITPYLSGDRTGPRGGITVTW